MTNKLLEILEELELEVDKLDPRNNPASFYVILKEKLVEYAKHVTSIGSSDPLWTEFQVCRIAFERRIDQDLQTLNN